MKRILTVDDDAANRFLMVQILRRNGFEPVALDSGLKVMETVARIEPALILLDIMMPDRDGISVLRQLKGNVKLASIPVIMVTARGESEMLSVALEAGAADYVKKPVDSVELLARINAALKLAMYMEENRKLDQLKILQEMVGAVSHNVNQPLTALRTYVALLDEKTATMDGRERVEPYLRGIHSAMEELIEMVEKLKNLSRYERVKYMGDVQIVDINQAQSDTNDPDPEKDK